MSTIRIEREGNSNLSRVYLWLTRHRGQVIELDPTRRLSLGVPISGARAVIVAAVLEDDKRPQTHLGGVLRAVSNRTATEPVRLVFDGRFLGGLRRDEAEVEAAGILERMSELLAEDDLVAEVA
jgi:hypothetical protein